MSSQNGEDLKVGLHCGRALRIGQAFALSVANGESLGLIRFAGRGPSLLSNVLDDMVRYPEDRQIFYLAVIQRLVEEALYLLKRQRSKSGTAGLDDSRARPQF